MKNHKREKEELFERCKHLEICVEVLKSELSDVLKALRDLHDEQNGPPLIRREDDWNKAMGKAYRILKKTRRMIFYEVLTNGKKYLRITDEETALQIYESCTTATMRENSPFGIKTLRSKSLNQEVICDEDDEDFFDDELWGETLEDLGE